MEKVMTIKYVANDGTEFDCELECIDYERNMPIPEGIILLDENGNRLSKLKDIENSWYAYLPNEKDVDWFEMASKEMCVVPDGAVAGQHIYYSDYDEYWLSIEEKINIFKEMLAKFDKN